MDESARAGSILHMRPKDANKFQQSQRCNISLRVSSRTAHGTTECQNLLSCKFEDCSLVGVPLHVRVPHWIMLWFESPLGITTATVQLPAVKCRCRVLEDGKGIIALLACQSRRQAACDMTRVLQVFGPRATAGTRVVMTAQ